MFEADYIGRRAYHLLGAYDANQPNLFAPGLIDAFNTVKAGRPVRSAQRVVLGGQPGDRG